MLLRVRALWHRREEQRESSAPWAALDAGKPVRSPRPAALELAFLLLGLRNVRHLRR
ncbi:hypothetical protein ACFV4F_12910 [Kitasatospora sp. NPDC059722]|uniref:hypothetical protein n=1 Tax=Kitasatospora sp. NPDC059722 TaxID=3346925 RepID=UPI0036C59959